MLCKWVCFTAMWCLLFPSSNDVFTSCYHQEWLACQQCPWRLRELMSELKALMLVVKDTEGITANRSIVLNNATANVAATITIILVLFCPSPSVQFIYKFYGFGLQNISQICQLLSKSIIITLAQTTTLSYLDYCINLTDWSPCFHSYINSTHFPQ